jgi:16S rRNA (guanine527-N7)-methyltransferase
VFHVNRPTRTCGGEPDTDAEASLAALAVRYRLGERQNRQLGTVLSVLAGALRAPTSVRTPECAVDVHIADSLVALELEVVRSARTIADVGSGAGFPGLALAVALTGCEVALVESQRRKCGFLEELLSRAAVENARVVCTRAEEWRDGADAHDVVVARAVAAQPVVLEYAAPLLRIGGCLVDWRGRRSSDEEAGLRAASELGMELAAVERVEPFEGARDHHLHVYLKVSETPARFPRRAGMARKRPLGR